MLSSARVLSWVKSIVAEATILLAVVACAQSRGSGSGQPGNRAEGNLVVTVTVVSSVGVVFDSNERTRIAIANAADPSDDVPRLQVGWKGSPRKVDQTREAVLRSTAPATSITYALSPVASRTDKSVEEHVLYAEKGGRRVEIGVLKTLTVVFK